MTSKILTLQYYNVFITKNEQITDINFTKFLDWAIKMKDHKYENVYFKDMKLDSEMEDTNDRAMIFADYRIRNPKEGPRGSSISKDVQGELFEQTVAFYKSSAHLLIFEYNYYGAKISAILKLFRSLLPTDTDDKWDIIFCELSAQHSINNVLTAKEITDLKIKLNLTSSQVDIFRKNNKEKQTYTKQLVAKEETINEINNYVESTLEHAVNHHALFGGGSWLLNLTRGKARQEFNLDAIKALLVTLDIDSNIFESVKLNYKDQNNNTYKNIDLKNSKVLSKKIDCDGDGWQYLTRLIQEDYYNNQEHNNEFSKYPIENRIKQREYPFKV